ncbi:MAG: hypothetical protein NC299_08870 [Lachnospiraceae bacterium]|nr:hypothetical protein [Lachnospiraceae bacterium]
MLIKIISGNYGHSEGKSVKIKTANDEPFEVSDEEARRLKKLGIADADAIVAGAMVLAKGSGEDISASDPDDDGDDEDVPEYSADSTNSELQAIAKNHGIEVPPHANKAQLIAALDEFFYDAPSIGAKEPE